MVKNAEVYNKIADIKEQRDHPRYRRSRLGKHLSETINEAMKTLSIKQKEDLFIHDLRGDTFTIFISTVNFIEIFYPELPMPAEKKPPSLDSTDPLAKEKFLRSTVLSLVNSAKDVIDYLKVNTDKFSTLQISDEQKVRAESAKNIFLALAASARFLLEPSPTNYELLINEKVNARDIGIVTDCDVSNLPKDITLNGVDAVIAYNAAKNAFKYGENHQAAMNVDERGRLIISNISLNDLPENYASFGIKGKDGGTGMGMGIMELYSSLQGRILDVSREFNEKDHKYTISVTI